MKMPRGFSMIELMVSVTLAIVVTDAAVSLFLVNKNTASTTGAIAAVADNGRFALSFIEQSVRSGGYMACDAINDLHGFPPVGTVVFKQLNVLPAGATPVQNSYQFAFGGYEAVNSGQGGNITALPMPLAADTNNADWLRFGGGGLDALLTANSVSVPGVIKGSDVLVVRETLPQTPSVYTTALYAAGANTINVNNTGSLASLTLPHAAVISNCSFSAAFQITGIAAGAPGSLTMAASVPINFDPNVSVTPVDTAIFYIGPGRDRDGALFVWHDDTGLSTELVPDVENMQVLYGVAPNTPNLATAYVTADQVTDFNRVISVKVALLMASPPGVPAVLTPAAAPTFPLLGTTVTAPADTRLRKVFDMAITARNAAL